MKVKNILVEIKSDKEVFEELRKTAKDIKAGKRAGKKESLVFSDLKQMRSFLTTERLKLLHLIKEKRPSNIYQLAKLAEKDYATIYKNVQALQELGLIEMHENKPQVNYEKISLEIAV